MMRLNVFVLLQVAFACAQDEYVDTASLNFETVLTDDDFKRARLIVHNETEEIDDTEMCDSDLFEGDIVDDDSTSLGGVQSSDHRSNRIARYAVRDETLRWPGGVVYYTISTQYTEQERAEIAAAMDEIMRLTCVRFHPRTDQTDYVQIAPIDGCFSATGRKGGMQKSSLISKCLRKGIIMHELMHTLGFRHEQGRADRDRYVTILWDNIQNGRKSQFQIYPLSETDYLGTEYDYGSIMHYHSTAFSKNRKPTIEPKQEGVTIGQRRRLSDTDVYRINRLYNCPSVQTTTQQTPTSTTGKTISLETTTQQITETPRKCEDRSDRCRTISSAGLCNSRSLADFVRKNCPLTCHKCNQLN